MISTKLRTRSVLIAILGLTCFSSQASATNSLSVSEPYFARYDGSKWRSFDPETAPPLRGEYIRVGFRYSTDRTVEGIERRHTIRNSNGEEYRFDVTFRGATKSEGNHITYVSFKVPGDAPDSLSYSGMVKANGAGARHTAFDIPVSGEFVPLKPDIHNVWIAPQNGSVFDPITRPLRPGEIVRLAVEYYTERSHNKKDDHLDVIFDIDDIDYRPVAYKREIDGAGYHVSYRWVMVPTTSIGDYSPTSPWSSNFSATVAHHSSLDYADSGSNTFHTEPVEAAPIQDPVAPALYISKKKPSQFLNPNDEDHYTNWKLKSDTHLEPGDTFYTYIVWKEDGHLQPADMVLGTRFEIPELGKTRTWKKRWRLRGGYSYKKFTLPADIDVDQISFKGALDAIGGSKARVYGETAEIKIKKAPKKGKK